MKLPDYLKLRTAWKKGTQDVPLSPARVLLDDINKVIIIDEGSPKWVSYSAATYPPSHHID